MEKMYMVALISDNVNKPVLVELDIINDGIKTWRCEDKRFPDNGYYNLDKENEYRTYKAYDAAVLCFGRDLEKLKNVWKEYLHSLEL